MKSVLLFFCLIIATSQAFVVPSSSRPVVSSRHTLLHAQEDKSHGDDGVVMTSKIATATAAFWTSLPVSMALADSPDWGLFEGRTGSLLHPLAMGGLLLYSLYTGFLGFQWRRQRTIGAEISQVKATIPKESEEDSNVDVAAVKLAQTQLEQLQKERKDLSQAAPRDKHFTQGALLAFLGTAFAIEGPLNTYARAGKLFPGPHLYAGAALVVLWSLAAACVPAMTKGNEMARNIHIGANALGVAFFAWQVTTGIPILLKVVELTHWP